MPTTSVLTARSQASSSTTTASSGSHVAPPSNTAIYQQQYDTSYTTPAAYQQQDNQQQKRVVEQQSWTTQSFSTQQQQQQSTPPPLLQQVYGQPQQPSAIQLTGAKPFVLGDAQGTTTMQSSIEQQASGGMSADEIQREAARPGGFKSERTFSETLPDGTKVTRKVTATRKVMSSLQGFE